MSTMVLSLPKRGLRLRNLGCKLLHLKTKTGVDVGWVLLLLNPTYYFSARHSSLTSACSTLAMSTTGYAYARVFPNELGTLGFTFGNSSNRTLIKS
ncbi:hypothetical protein [Nostoc sp. WHI]|uniref:hypothetical protein n=1 Tax=Nostoc sp. WHI TaxID=2650611 RepID=UPI0018C58B6C|nr:hypothetical protein [Nostoc sp. WHI]MBG1270957.1 hypothetical protein [Nostoc sp. WHI]